MTMSLDILGKWGCDMEQDGNSARPSNAPPYPLDSEHCSHLSEEQGQKGISIPRSVFCTSLSNLDCFGYLQIVVPVLLILGGRGGYLHSKQGTRKVAQLVWQLALRDSGQAMPASGLQTYFE